MRNLHTLALALGVIINSIEISSGASPESWDILRSFLNSDEHEDHQELSSEYNSSVKDDSINSDPRGGTSNSLGRHHPPKMNLPPARPNIPSSSVRSSPPAEPFLRPRSRSPPAIPYPIRLWKLLPEQFKSVRLIPNCNRNRTFEIRRFTFPSDKPMLSKGRYQSYGPMKTDEQTVLLTSDGEIFAIVERGMILRGMYIQEFGVPKRVRMNMYNKVITKMTPEEIRETLLSTPSPISKCFRIVNVRDVRPDH